MFALFKLLFIVILAILFYIFTACARLTQKAGNYIIGNKSNVVSRTYETQNIFDNIFLEFIKLVRDYNLCGYREYSREETIIAIGIYFYFISAVHCMLEINPANMNSPLRDELLKSIIKYVIKYEHALKFQYSSVRFFNIDFYTLDNLSKAFLSANEKYITILRSLPKGSQAVLEVNEAREFTAYLNSLYSTMEDVICSELEYYHDDKYELDKILLLKEMSFLKSSKFIIELNNMAITFSKQVIYAALLGR